MKSLGLMVVAGVGLFVGCTDAPPKPVGEARVLGALELEVNASTALGSSVMARPAATLADSAVTVTPTAFTVQDARGVRYFTASFSVKNNTTTAFKNLSLVLYAQSGQSLGGTGIKSLKNFAENPITDATVAQRIKPANGMSSAVTVDASKADFQVFTTAEATQIQTDARAASIIGASDTVLEYGFTARNGSARGIAAGATGQITLAFRVPNTASDTTKPHRFVVTSVVYDASTTRVARSREETAVSATTRATAITDRTNPTEVILVGADTETSSCTNCTVTRRANAVISSAPKNLLDDPTAVTFSVQEVKSGVGIPWNIAFGPDAKMYFTQRGSSTVAINRMDVDTGTVTTFTSTSSVRVEGEGGVLGFTFDPDFATNNHVYICYSYWSGAQTSANRRNRLSRFTISGSSLTDEQIRFDNMLGWSNHNGCRVANGPDGKLYFSMGDAADFTPGPVKAQDPAVLAGKIFRINYDGSIPTDNPRYGSLTGQARAMWSFGHRNPQGLAFQPVTNALWSTEHGPDIRDELNLIEANKNYGWPQCVGEQALNVATNGYSCAADTNLTAGNYQPAKKQYNADNTIATSDIAFLNSPLFPEWKGNLLMAVLKNNDLYRIELNGAAFARDQQIISSGYGRIRDVTSGPDGFIYFSTDDNGIWRVIPQ
ncbi:MAG: PQQ-dependent sugar dehydrogenase [Pleurocapsa sp. SU_196_0]|nr:PQQ-dependent sugar dehydrogenase [Pleurocapsa sp. SU_196_0]